MQGEGSCVGVGGGGGDSAVQSHSMGGISGERRVLRECRFPMQVKVLPL